MIDEEEWVRYVALGDSYTIGTAEAPEARWPTQLAERVPGLAVTANLGVNGYTSADLIRDELPRLAELAPEFVSVLVGVNDVVQGVAEDVYARNASTILDALRAQLPANRIVVAATPDYTRTPRGVDYGEPDARRAAIVRVNALMADACRQRGIAFVPEIFELSQRAGQDRSLVADDGLHPSAAQYRLWVDAIEPVVRRLLDG